MMLPKKTWWLLLSGIVVAGFTGCQAGPVQRSSPILAVVGNEDIRLDDLKDLILSRYLGRPALHSLITLKLYQIEAKSLGLTVTAEELKLATESRFQKVSPTVLAEFNRRGFSTDELMHELRWELQLELLRNKVIRARRKIGEYEIQHLYDRTAARSRRQVSHIAIAFLENPAASSSSLLSDRDIEQARKAASGIIRQLREGADFAALAEEFSADPRSSSSGGAMGLIYEDSFAEGPLRQAVQKLKEGEISDPIRDGDFGFQIFKVIRVLDPEPLTEELRAHLKQQLQEFPPTAAEIQRVEQELRIRCGISEFPENMPN